MTKTKTTLVAVYDDYATARKVENELIQQGFSQGEIRVSSKDSERVQTAGTGAAANYTSTHEEEGGISGFFHRLFGSDDDAQTGAQYRQDAGRYAEAVEGGRAVVTATIDDDRIEQVTAVLNRYDPYDLDQRTADSPAAGLKTPGAVRSGTTTGERVIPVVEEDLQVGKRTVQSGGVRVYSRVTETPVEENVTLREEHARVERRPVDRPATEADFRMKNEVIEVVETAEEAVVAKNSRVVEEVVVGKESSERTQTVRDTVRHTDVQVEQFSPEKMSGDFQSDYKTRYANEPAAKL